MNYQKLRLEKHATNQRVEFSTLFLHDVERFIGFTQPPFRIIPPLNARQVFGSRVSWCWKQKPAGKIAFRSWFCFARKSVWNRDLALKRRKLPRPEWSDLSAIVFLFRVYFFARFVRVLCVNYYYSGLILHRDLEFTQNLGQTHAMSLERISRLIEHQLLSIHY